MEEGKGIQYNNTTSNVTRSVSESLRLALLPFSFSLKIYSFFLRPQVSTKDRHWALVTEEEQGQDPP